MSANALAQLKSGLIGLAMLIGLVVGSAMLLHSCRGPDPAEVDRVNGRPNGTFPELRGPQWGDDETILIPDPTGPDGSYQKARWGDIKDDVRKGRDPRLLAEPRE